jgi:hypothetical protein
MVLFNFFINVRYNHVKIAGDEATLQTSNVNLRNSIKKYDVFTIKEKHGMFS